MKKIFEFTFLLFFSTVSNSIETLITGSQTKPLKFGKLLYFQKACVLLFYSQQKNLKIRSIPWIPSALSSYLVPILSLSNLLYLLFELSFIRSFIYSVHTNSCIRFIREDETSSYKRKRERENLYLNLFIFW